MEIKKVEEIDLDGEELYQIDLIKSLIEDIRAVATCTPIIEACDDILNGFDKLENYTV